MKYVIEKNPAKDNQPVGYIIWEETDFPKKELLKHPVPTNYKGTSESKYLLELFELSWSNGDYVPKGYLPLYNRFPQTDADNSKYEITPFKDLDYATATRLIFQSVFHRFGIKYYDTSLGEDVFDKIDKMGIPFLAHKELIPQDVDSVYYFALLFKHELFNKMGTSAIIELLKNSETNPYPKDENGYLDIVSLIKFSKSFKKTNWTVSPKNTILKEWNPHIVAPIHWDEFYQLYLTYGDEGFVKISESIELRDIKPLMRMAKLFEIDNYSELLETYNNIPKEWLEKISLEEN